MKSSIVNSLKHVYVSMTKSDVAFMGWTAFGLNLGIWIILLGFPPEKSQNIWENDQHELRKKGGNTIQESYNTPLEHTPGNSQFANYERNPFIARW